MKAVIKKIKLKKLINKYYFRIELVDENRCPHVLDKPLLCEYINFRRQLFGIMSACGSYDLMQLATTNPIEKRVKGYYINGLQILENKDKEWLRYDKEKRKYVCDIDKKGRKIIDLLISQNLSNIEVMDGKIESIVSRSGVFSMLFTSKSASTFYMTSHTQIFWGFGSPINIGNPEDIVGATESAKVFASFIVSLMNFYKTDDLLNIGGNIENYPVVEITINNNNEISSITNPSTGMGFSIDKGYEFIDINKLEKNKIK